MISVYFTFLGIVVVLLVAEVVYFASLCVKHYLSRSSHTVSSSRHHVAAHPTSTTEALRLFVLDYIDDYFSPMGEVAPSDRLLDDLGLDSLDIQSMLSDIGQVTLTHPSAEELFKIHGLGTTVNDLVLYVRSLMVQSQNNG